MKTRITMILFTMSTNFQHLSVRFILLLLLALTGLSCGDDTNGSNQTEVPISARLTRDSLVFGGKLGITIENSQLISPYGATIRLVGDLDGQAIDTSLTTNDVQVTDSTVQLWFAWSDVVQSLSLQDGSRFTGNIDVKLLVLDTSRLGRGQINPASILFHANLTPSLTLTTTSVSTYIDEPIGISADNLLLSDEGTSLVHFVGTFSDDDGQTHAIDTSVFVQVTNRNEATLQIPGWAFGIAPGHFEGTMTPINRLASGSEKAGDASQVSIDLNLTELGSLSTTGASRGQSFSAFGRGLVATDSQHDLSMLFRLEGSFTDHDGNMVEFTNNSSLQLAPEQVISSDEARLAIRSEYEETDTPGIYRLTGLGATPGRFSGQITPVLIYGSTFVKGVAYSTTFDILPTRQYIFVKFIPAYIDSLELFGLRNVEPEIRTRIFEVCQDAFDGVNIVFSELRPNDFVEYSVIEVGGPDPNNAGLFGLDNSSGKDVDNIRLDDIVGSENAESSESGSYSFGGVFIESFIAFSPQMADDQTMAVETFDDIMSPFTPDLGGTPVGGLEWPDGPRKAEIELAIYAFGGIIGNTIVHEIGHSLGLSHYPTDRLNPGGRFHNQLDEVGAIMDSGGNRSFEERAGLDGAPDPHFNERNFNYLQEVLPLPQ